MHGGVRGRKFLNREIFSYSISSARTVLYIIICFVANCILFIAVSNKVLYNDMQKGYIITQYGGEYGKNNTRYY